jgi:5S rRNA maturation endonuclease (ribonuclease M5)
MKTAKGPPDAQAFDDELGRLKALDCIIVVEGKRDIKALAVLGITNVVSLDAPLFKVVERIAENIANTDKKIVILTDLDAEGRKLYHELSIHFQRLGIKVDDRFREFLFRTPLRHIEGLDTFIDNLRTRAEE